MLGQVAGEADEFVRERDGLGDGGVVRIEPGLLDMSFGQAFAPASPDRIGEGRRDVGREAERLAHLADGHARPVVNHGGADRGPVAAVAPVEVLDDFLTPFVLEIDVDVGRLAALARDEAREEQVAGFGIDGRDAEAVADSAVRGRAATLAQDTFALSELDNVINRQKVFFVLEFCYQAKFFSYLILNFRRNVTSITPLGSAPR